MGAQLIEEAEPPVLGPEADEVAAEEAHEGRAVAVHQVRRHREREPVVLPQEPTHRGVVLDAGQELVLGRGDHGRLLRYGSGSLMRTKSVAAVSGTPGWCQSSTGNDTMMNE